MKFTIKKLKATKDLMKKRLLKYMEMAFINVENGANKVASKSITLNEEATRS